MATENKSQKMLLCDECDGDGTIQHSEVEDYHRGEFKFWKTICTQCKGSGRMLKTVTTITEIVPYDNSEVSMILLKESHE